jgi:HK97 gp10 family phage protein
MPVVYNRIPQIMITAPIKVETALAKTAFDTQISAIQRAPVDTGNLVNSIRAEKLGAFKWTVTAHADYAIYVEVGTRNMSGREYMVGALRQTWPGMMQALRNVGLGSV